MSKPETNATEPRPVGRPVEVSGRRVQVYLDELTIRAAKKIGGGNVSEGIRQALKIAASGSFFSG